MLEFYSKHQYLPEKICSGFASYLALSIPDSMSENQYFVTLGTQRFEVKDPYAAQYYQWSINFSIEETVFKILSDEEIWGENLTNINGFYQKVLHLLLTLPHFSHKEQNPFPNVKDVQFITHQMGCGGMRHDFISWKRGVSL